MLIVIKFGGTSVGSAERIQKAAKIIADTVRDGHKVVVVTSAMSGVTNGLVEILEGFKSPSANEADRIGHFFSFAKKLEQKHHEAAREAIGNATAVEETVRMLYSERHDLERVLLGSHFLGELTPIGYDFVVSAGERLCVPVLAGSIKGLGIDAVPLGDYGANIITDNNYGNARPNFARTREEVRRTLLPLLEAGQTPVCPGFYGKSEQGRIATLGRGGSDYSATLIGCALDADQIWIMTDVDGIKTCDPRIVPAAKTIDEMPYAVASEMAMLGAKVLHQKSVAPAAIQKIPLRIASSFEPEKPGTMLVPPGESPAAPVASLSLVKAGLVRIEADETAPGADDLNTRLYRAIEAQNVELLSSGGGQSGRSFFGLAAGASFTRLVEIAQSVAEEGIRVAIDQPVAVLGIVGLNLALQSNVLAQVAGTLGRVGAKSLFVMQGASPHSLVVVLRDDPQLLPIAMRTLHTELGLD